MLRYRRNDILIIKEKRVPITIYLVVSLYKTELLYSLTR